MNENEMLGEIKSLSPSEEAILTMLIRYQNLKSELEKEKKTSHYNQSQLDIANAKLIEEKEKNKELERGNRELNIIRLEYLVSQFPDTTETYKKYKKELDEAISNLKEE